MVSDLYPALLSIVGVAFGLMVWKSKAKKKSSLTDVELSRQTSFHVADELMQPDSNLLMDDVSPEFKESLSSAPKNNLGNLLTISVFAKPNIHFVSYDLLQAITGTGMQFGEMNIFHYYQRNPQGKKISLFSLVSATKPGDFDLDRIGNFSCVGLTFFMDIAQAPNPLQAFYLMVNTAEELAEDLDGELRIDPKTAWSSEYFKECEKRIMQSSEQNSVLQP